MPSKLNGTGEEVFGDSEIMRRYNQKYENTPSIITNPAYEYEAYGTKEQDSSITN
jgi:hypothetical protein